MANAVCRNVICLWIVISIPLCCAAQQRVSGTVTNKSTHKPLPGAAAKLESDLLPTMVQTTSDAGGRFTFLGLSPGNYTLTVRADTFYPEQLSFTLRPRGIETLQFELRPFTSISEQVTVTGQTRLLDETQAATITTIDSIQLGSLPSARRTQLTDVITPFVSSAVASHDNLVHLRGNELSLNTFINGVSFFDNPHPLFTPGLSPDVIQSVNIITGGFPAEFGNRFGGILDIVTRSGFDSNNHGSLTLGAGGYSRNNVAFDYGGHRKRFGYFFYGQGFESRRFLNSPELTSFHDFGKGARSFLQLDYHPTTSDSFRFLVTGDGTNLELPNTTEDEQRRRDFFQRNREQTAILSWDHTLSQASFISTSFYERFVGARLLPTSDPDSIQASGLRDDITIGAKSDYSLELGTRHAIKAGVDLMLLRLREDFSFEPRDKTEIEQFILRGRKTGGQASAYFQDQYRPLKNLTANIGLRYDQYSLVTNGQAVSPRLNLAYALNSGQTVLHFAYNRFFAPPPIENLLLSTRLGFKGQPPRISRSNHFEGGVSRSIHDRLVVGVIGYWRSDRNSFETTEVANVRIFVPTTFARGKAYGIEFSSQLAEIKRLGLSGYFNYTAQRAFQTGPVSGGFTIEDVQPDERNPAAFDQIHTANGGVNWRERRTGFWAGAALEYGSGTPATVRDANGAEMRLRLPEHLVVDFYSGVDLFRRERRHASLQFNVENLTNRVFRIAKESQFTPVQFSPPRFISGSLKLQF